MFSATSFAAACCFLLCFLQAVQHVQANPDVVCPAGWRPGDRCVTPLFALLFWHGFGAAVLQAAAASRELCMQSSQCECIAIIGLVVGTGTTVEKLGVHRQQPRWLDGTGNSAFAVSGL
jgi:hypothetical protein